MSKDRGRVLITVDVAVLTVRQGRLSVLAERADPQRRSVDAADGVGLVGAWQLPQRIMVAEELDDVAASVLQSAGGVIEANDAQFVEQLRTYGRLHGSQTERALSVAYVALVAESSLAPPTGRVFAVDDLHETGVLAEGHARLLDDAVERVRAKFEYTTVATTLVTEPFTIPELRRVYESVWSVTLHPANFRRKVLATPGFVVADDVGIDGRRGHDLFRRGTAALLHPAMLRPLEAERE